MTEAAGLANEFLRIAEELGARDDDAARRTAIGRAYHATVLLAAEVTGTPRDRAFHSNLRRNLDQMSQRAIATRMGQMHYLRNVADYQAVPESERDADWSRNWRQAQRDAALVIPLLLRLLDETAPSS